MCLLHHLYIFFDDHNSSNKVPLLSLQKEIKYIPICNLEQRTTATMKTIDSIITNQDIFPSTPNGDSIEISEMKNKFRKLKEKGHIKGELAAFIM